MNRTINAIYLAAIGLLLSFGLIGSAPGSDNHRTMRSSGVVVPVRRKAPAVAPRSIFNVGQSIRFLFVAEDDNRLAFS